MTMAQQWDTGYLIGMAITIIFTAGAFLAVIGAAITALVTRGGRGVPTMIVAATVMVIAGIVGTVVAWPFSGQYHRYQPLGGTVASVSSRLIASDTTNGGSTQKFVLTFTDGSALGCNDTRCSAVKAGDNVELMCERAYQWNAPSPGWDCNWGIDRERNGTSF
jgi:hypothetical protein